MRTTARKTRGTSFYYAVAGIISIVAIMAVGIWLVTGASDLQIPLARKTATDEVTMGTKTATGLSPADGVGATDAELDELSQEAEQDLSEIESILAEIDRIEVDEDANVESIGL